MNISKEELDSELDHLDKTLKIITRVIEEKNSNIEDYKSQIVERKKFIWQNKNEYNEPELYNTMDEEDLSVNIINKDIKKVYRLYRSLENPFFTRIDFKESDEPESFYIGITGVEDDYEPVVYDWRANIANLYYNYGIGPAEYPTPTGFINGTITLKRNFEFERGKFINIYDSDSNVNDALLDSVLKNNTSDVMKNIVGTIQTEQNEIIRYPNVPLIVEGVAGSGKTSVALHRIAYLLYNQKDLSYKNILIFSPSEIFSHYIANVLPELGEENVSTTTFNDFAKNYIPNKKIESLTEFIERYYENETHEDYESIKHKLSKEYKSEIDSFLNVYFASLKFTKKIGLKTNILSASELNDLKSKAPKNLNFHDRIEYIGEKICERLHLDEIKNVPKFYNIITKLLGIKKDPLELYKMISNLEFKDFIPYEDIFGILYLYFEIHGYPTLAEVKFVVIDEAQDYSIWQFEFLKSIFKSAKFTILGDPNQAINPYLKYNSLEEIKDTFKGNNYKKLKYTYRSSREIITYANELLGLDSSNIVRGYFGIKVMHLKESNLKEDVLKCIDLFKEKELKKIAVITKTKKETELIKKLNIDSIEVLPVYVSKGLEYDGVIIYTEKNNSFKDNEINLLYVAATRALHGLILINQEK